MVAVRVARFYNFKGSVDFVSERSITLKEQNHNAMRLFFFSSVITFIGCAQQEKTMPPLSQESGLV